MLRRSKMHNRSTAGVLADIAHQLSSTSDWTSRVQDALSMLCDIIPSHIGALGIQMHEWTTYFCPDPDDPSQLKNRLLEHYTLLTGAAPGVVGAKVNRNDVGVISQGEGDTGSFLSLPVIGADQVIGVLHVCVDEDDAYSPEDVSVLSIVAMQIGSYIKNIQARVESEERARELEMLRDEAERRKAEIESFIYSTTDGVMLFDAEGRVLLVNDAGKSILGAVSSGSIFGWAAAWQRYTLDGRPMNVEESAPMRALRGETVKDARYKLVSSFGRELALGISATPVRDSAGRVIGVVSIFRDISAEVDVQRQRQELFEREHNIAQMLQQALIPPQLEYDTEGVKIAVRYQPALKEAEVGGDFYDVFKLGNGRIGILVGDVAGKGLSAAIRVAAARYAVRSYAYLDSSPGVVMTLVNELLCRDEPGGEALMTAVYAVIDTSDSTVTYASGGHEPPLMRRADGQIEELAQGGRALGVDGGYTYVEASRKVSVGETLVIVTDGIIEARSGNVLFGPEGVQEFLKSHREMSPSQTATALLEAATKYAGGSLQDAAAIVVLEVECCG